MAGVVGCACGVGEEVSGDFSQYASYVYVFSDRVDVLRSRT